jgi:hypothetical protein
MTRLLLLLPLFLLWSLATPARAGDAATFVSETYPDGTDVPVDTPFSKRCDLNSGV